MFLIEQELIRYENWQEELESLNNQENNIMAASTNSSIMTDSFSSRKSKIPEPMSLRRPRSGLWNINDSLIQRAKTAHSLTNSRENSVDDLSELNNKLSSSTTSLDTEKTKKQLQILMKKQEQLLRVLFYLLLNIAEDIKIEEKMAKKNIVEMLVKTLDRDNIELLTLCVTFLKKLSIRGCNKDDLERLNCINKLSKLLSNYQDPELVHVTLKLLFNLTFDKKMRAKMCNIGLLPKLVSLLSDEKHQNILLKLLYQFSRDRTARPMFVYTDCVQLVSLYFVYYFSGI